MTYDTRLKDLFTKQENQIKAFEYHKELMRIAVSDTEQQLLQEHRCTYTDAPPEVLKIITKLREDYEKYWSNDGILLTALMRRQFKNREELFNLLTNK